ncbi:ComEC/Rec2 family competence protein [Rhizobium sp. BK176]|uniref:ComEC/Rec2 family competence protein n=1 Tax=Rhizobium sp. BK176 TaxID=2587071 RepID=UPI00386E36D4
MPGLKPFEVTKAVPAADASARAAEPSLLLNRSAAKLLPAMRTQSSIAWPTRIKAATRDWASWLQGSATAEMEHGRLFLFSPVFLGAGAVLWFELASDPPTMRLMAWVVVLAPVAMAAGQGRPFVRSSALAGLLCVAGMLSAQYETRSRATVILDTPVTTTITGRVERREGDGAGRWRYILSISATQSPQIRRPPDRVSVVARGQKEPFEIGEWLTGRARLTPPAGPALPGLNDFAFSAYFDEIGANGFFYGSPSVSMPPAVGTPSISERGANWLDGLRSGIGDRIRGILPGDTGAFAASLVTDERRAISRETTDALRQAGLAHIVAISGLNMALSAGIFFVGLRQLLSLFPSVTQAYPTKKIAAAGALVALTAYYMISGFAVSAERAFIMMAIMLAAVFFDRPSISLRNIALSAWVILLLSPSEALGASFQMSFAATLALVAGYAMWSKRAAREHPLLQVRAVKPVVFVARFFAGILLSSMIGGFSTALFAVEHFHRLSAYGLPANLMAMPVISFVVMPMGMFAMLLTPFGLDIVPWKIAGFGLEIVIAIAKMVSGWGGNVDIGRLPVWYFPVAVAGFLVLALLRTRLRYLGAVAIALATLLVVLAPSRPAPDFIIAEDGGLVAIVDNQVIASNRTRPPDFIFDQWRRALVAEQARPPLLIEGVKPVRRRDGDGKPRRLSADELHNARNALRQVVARGVENRFVCLKGAWCTAAHDSGYVLTIIEDPAYVGAACDTADIVVTPARLRANECRSGALLFTGETLRRSGAAEIRIDEQGTPVVTTAYTTLDRPWMRHRAYNWRSGTFDGEPPVFSDSGE